MRRLNFTYECDKFCEENADLIKGKDFDQTQFYKELANTMQGKQYRRYTPNYNNIWMRRYLTMHMNNQRNQREKQEQKERIRRQRSYETHKRQQSYNSSFGRSFRGGFSSGGGFKGGW